MTDLKELPCPTCISFAICNSKNCYVINNGNGIIIPKKCSLLDEYIYKDPDREKIDKKISEYIECFIDITIINLEATVYTFEETTDPKVKFLREVK
jgi:hypothetical protein